MPSTLHVSPLRHLLSRVWRIFQGAVFEWNEDKVPRMAAAIAFYTLFALTPIVIISIAVGSTLFDEASVRREMLDQVVFLIGADGAAAIELLLANAPPREASRVATVAGLAALFFAATGVFVELKDSLNTIWEVQPKPGLGLVEMIKDRLLSFAMVLVIGFLLLVSLITSALLAALSREISHYLPLPVSFLAASDVVISFGVVTILFALIYHFLPDARVAWHHVWLGAAVTALLFVLGKLVFGWYLGHSTISSSYGAAGSLVIVVLWTYYSALILLFGAEVSFVAARQSGEQIVPAEKAVHVTEHARIQQGIPHQESIPQETHLTGPRPLPTPHHDPPIKTPHWFGFTALSFLTGYLLAALRQRRNPRVKPPADPPDSPN